MTYSSNGITENAGCSGGAKGLATLSGGHINSVFNRVLEEEIFMRQPEKFVVEGQEQFVCRLIDKRSFYGLKKSPHCWYSTLDEYLKRLGFVQSFGDPCIYVGSGGEMIIGVYVNDIVIAGRVRNR